MMHLHHGCEDVVVKLAPQLRHHHFIDTEGIADGYVVNLQYVVFLFYSCGIDTGFLLDRPALTAQEVADEVDGRKTASEGRIVDDE